MKKQEKYDILSLSNKVLELTERVHELERALERFELILRRNDEMLENKIESVMKLRNRKTGIIGRLYFEPDKEYHFTVLTEDPADVMIYKNLAALYAEWEDYEEPKEYWRITDLGELKSIRLDQHHQSIKKCKEIGNYFETKEEAEKAVEKLKAWKRLKDNGFRFKTYMRNPQGTYDVFAIWKDQIPPSSSDISQDLNLLFGGEK